MSVKRTITIGIIGGSVAVWLAAAATSTIRPIATVAIPKSGPVDKSGAELASEIIRLHERLRPDAVPSRSRDLFRYVPRGAGRRSALDPAVVVEAPSPELVPAPFPLKLLGIAEQSGDSGQVFSAVMSASGELFIVKEGDPITSAYRVQKISADGVELLNIGDNTPVRLVLP